MNKEKEIYVLVTAIGFKVVAISSISEVEKKRECDSRNGYER
jgi:hypothetical protein